MCIFGLAPGFWLARPERCFCPQGERTSLRKTTSRTWFLPRVIAFRPWKKYCGRRNDAREKIRRIEKPGRGSAEMHPDKEFIEVINMENKMGNFMGMVL